MWSVREVVPGEETALVRAVKPPRPQFPHLKKETLRLNFCHLSRWGLCPSKLCLEASVSEVFPAPVVLGPSYGSSVAPFQTLGGALGRSGFMPSFYRSGEVAIESFAPGPPPTLDPDPG